VLRLNEPLAAAFISSFSTKPSASAPPPSGSLALLLTPGSALPWLRSAIAARPAAVLGGYAAAYLTLQTLSIPGCTILDAAAGATLGVGVALPL
jgi:hypothetical protein